MLAHLELFRLSVQDCKDAISVAHGAHAAGAPTWTPSVRAMFSEAAFLKTFVAWETFLEATFLDYLLGMPSAAGDTVPRFVQPIDRSHANKILIGKQTFFDWSSPDIVLKFSGLFLQNGEPYQTVLAGISKDILDLKTIRNASAHLSSTTRAALDALATRKLGLPMAGCSPSDLLFAVDPESPNADTVFNVYCNLLDTAAMLIAHAGNSETLVEAALTNTDSQVGEAVAATSST